jgi:hypothetical protein
MLHAGLEVLQALGRVGDSMTTQMAATTTLYVCPSRKAYSQPRCKRLSTCKHRCCNIDSWPSTKWQHPKERTGTGIERLAGTGRDRPAYATVITVELLLGHVVIVKVAGAAAVSPKANPTAAAAGRYWLPTVAKGTDHLGDSLAVQGVAFDRVLQARSSAFGKTTCNMWVTQ